MAQVFSPQFKKGIKIFAGTISEATKKIGA